MTKGTTAGIDAPNPRAGTSAKDRPVREASVSAKGCWTIGYHGGMSQRIDGWKDGPLYLPRVLSPIVLATHFDGPDKAVGVTAPTRVFGKSGVAVLDPQPATGDRDRLTGRFVSGATLARYHDERALTVFESFDEVVPYQLGQRVLVDDRDRAVPADKALLAKLRSDGARQWRRRAWQLLRDDRLEDSFLAISVAMAYDVDEADVAPLAVLIHERRYKDRPEAFEDFLWATYAVKGEDHRSEAGRLASQLRQTRRRKRRNLGRPGRNPAESQTRAAQASSSKKTQIPPPDLSLGTPPASYPSTAHPKASKRAPQKATAMATAD